MKEKYFKMWSNTNHHNLKNYDDFDMMIKLFVSNLKLDYIEKRFDLS